MLNDDDLSLADDIMGSDEWIWIDDLVTFRDRFAADDNGDDEDLSDQCIVDHPIALCFGYDCADDCED